MTDAPTPYRPVPGRFHDLLKAQFLDRLVECGAVGEAAHAVGVAQSTIRTHYQKDAVFREKYDEALQRFRESLELEAHKRGVKGTVMGYTLNEDGTKVPLYRYSDKLLELLLKRHIPEFRDHVRVDSVNVNAEVSIEDLAKKLSPEDRKTLRALLSKLQPSNPGGADVHDSGPDPAPAVQSEVLGESVPGGQPDGAAGSDQGSDTGEPGIPPTVGGPQPDGD